MINDVVNKSDTKQHNRNLSLLTIQIMGRKQRRAQRRAPVVVPTSSLPIQIRKSPLGRSANKKKQKPKSSWSNFLKYGTAAAGTAAAAAAAFHHYYNNHSRSTEIDPESLMENTGLEPRGPSVHADVRAARREAAANEWEAAQLGGPEETLTNTEETALANYDMQDAYHRYMDNIGPLSTAIQHEWDGAALGDPDETPLETSIGFTYFPHDVPEEEQVADEYNMLQAYQRYLDNRSDYPRDEDGISALERFSTTAF